MTELLLHPTTRKQSERIILKPPHAILLSGKTGSGKLNLALTLSSELLGYPAEKLESHPYFSLINPDEPVITIDEVRSLQQFLKLKVPSSDEKKIKRVALIVAAERMRVEAQNALLKTLEEPPAGTVIILTSNHSDRLLATITSRTRELSLLPVDRLQARQYFSSVDDNLFERSYALAQGQAGLLAALLEDQQHPLLSDIELAKTIISEKLSDRLLRIEELSKNKQIVSSLIDALLRLTHAGLHSASLKQNKDAVKTWHDKQTAVLRAVEYLQKNANTKLVLDDLFLSI